MTSQRTICCISTVAAFSVLASCGGPSGAAPSVFPVQESSAANSTPLGSVNGEPINFADLSTTAHRRMRDIENETGQRRLHTLWAGIEEVIANRLLTGEAKRRNITVDELRDREIGSKVTPPSDDEVRSFYDDNLAVSGVAFDAAAPHVRSELMAQRFANEERSFIDQLRVKADVRFNLPAPSLPREPVDSGPGPSWGPQNAKVTIVEFSDFQCPYCARASKMLHELRGLYPNDLRIEFRDFPLQQHPQARKAAEAARCADEQKKFWDYHDLLFANPRALESADLLRYAEQAQLNVDEFKLCLASDRPQNAVREAEAAAQKLGIEGTPLIYINGIKLIGLLPLPLVQSLVNRELAQ